MPVRPARTENSRPILGACLLSLTANGAAAAAASSGVHGASSHLHNENETQINFGLGSSFALAALAHGSQARERTFPCRLPPPFPPFLVGGKGAAGHRPRWPAEEFKVQEFRSCASQRVRGSSQPACTNDDVLPLFRVSDVLFLGLRPLCSYIDHVCDGAALWG